MNIKTNVQDEPIFFGRKALFFKTLNKKGIYTVEDYINTDIEQLSMDSSQRKQNRAYQDILKHKYLQAPLVVDVILNKEFDYGKVSIEDLNRRLNILGFGTVKIYSMDYLVRNIHCDDKGCFRMIDVIANKEIMRTMKALADFYVEYYINEMKEELNSEFVLKNFIAKHNNNGIEEELNSETTLNDFHVEQDNNEMNSETDVVNDKETLESLKNILIELLNQRNELDIKISSLLQQINTFEGGKVTSGRK